VVGRLRLVSRGNNGFLGWFDENGNPWDVEYLKEARELLDLTPIQTAFFAIILDRLGENTTSLEDISKIFIRI